MHDCRGRVRACMAACVRVCMAAYVHVCVGRVRASMAACVHGCMHGCVSGGCGYLLCGRCGCHQPCILGTQAPLHSDRVLVFCLMGGFCVSVGSFLSGPLFGPGCCPCVCQQQQFVHALLIPHALPECGCPFAVSLCCLRLQHRHRLAWLRACLQLLLMGPEPSSAGFTQ